MQRFFSLILILANFIASCYAQDQALQQEIATIESGLLGPINVKGQAARTYSMEERMAFHKVPGLSIAVVKDGVLRWAKGYGIADSEKGTPVTTTTRFQAGSISKPVAALAALKLMEEGKLDIDKDVNQYLQDWKVAENRFTEEEKVTVRRLLTHTAGTNVHGFPGYKPDAQIPSVTEVLNGKGNTDKVEVDTIPGSRWKYSGGGYTIMEKVVEDITGMPLEVYASSKVLQPLGMVNSTYEQPLPEDSYDEASAAYDRGGQLIAGTWHVYPEQAAAGLWTTPSDLAKYCIEVQEIAQGKEDGVFLRPTITAMLTKHMNDWGLGPSLAWAGDSLRFQHGGKNAGFTNSMIAFAYRSDAYIIMTNADNGMSLIREIARSLSAYYDWKTIQPREVEVLTLPDKVIKSYVGEYKYVEEVPEIGDYLVSITREDDALVVFDPNTNEKNVLRAVSETAFMNTDNGDELTFEEHNRSVFFWNNRFEFHKLEK
ncbi:MAG: serine hydrolase domain-containing protein [Bacteroidota bacterium]